MTNLTDLPIYYSKENLTTRFSDYSNVFMLPPICYFGVITNLICMIVSFRSDDSNDKTLNYIFINSVIDFFFLLIESFLVIIRCGILCPYGYKYASKFFEIYIYLYVGYTLVTAQILVSIYVSYDRLKIFSGKLTNKKPLSIYKVFAISMIVSIVVNAPTYLISKEVLLLGIYKPETNSTYYDFLYIRKTRPEFSTTLAQNLLTAILFVKDPIMFTVLCVLSIIVCVKFRIHLRAKKILVKKTVTSNRVILLIIYIIRRENFFNFLI